MGTPPVRSATAADADALAAIYNHYILKTVVTFEEEVIDASEMARRVAEVQSAGFPYLVVEEEGHVLGYAYGARWQNRCAYRHSAETTVYLHPDAVGRGLGRALYNALIPQLDAMGIHTLIAGIALPNAASVACHEAFDFDKAAHYREVGFKFGQWIDVGYWQRLRPREQAAGDR